MSKQDIIYRIDKNIILAKYEPSPIKHRKYQSEAELEDQLMTDLNQLGIPTLNLQKDHEKCLLSNLKQQMEELNKDVLNNEPLTTSEWEDFKRNGLFLGRDSKGIVVYFDKILCVQHQPSTFGHETISDLCS